MTVKKGTTTGRTISRAEARKAIRAVLKEKTASRTTVSKAWKKGGTEYNKVLGHFGATHRSAK